MASGDLAGPCARFGQQPGAFEIEDEAGQRVGQHVVHLAGESLAFAERGGMGLGGPGLLELDEQSLLPLVGLW